MEPPSQSYPSPTLLPASPPSSPPKRQRHASSPSIVRSRSHSPPHTATHSPPASNTQVLQTLVSLIDRVTLSAGLPQSLHPPPSNPELALHWLADRLESLNTHLNRRSALVVLPPPRDEFGSMIPYRQRQPAPPGSFVINDPDPDGAADGLEGVEDCKVDSEDDVAPEGLEPYFPPQRRSSKRSHVPRARSAATYSALPALPELEDGLFSARSSQAHMEARPPFLLPIGSAGNSYLTQMSSRKSLGQGEANKLHSDYSKIFPPEHSPPLELGESAIEIAGGDLYNPGPLKDRWIVSEKIGEGGYSTVYLATQNPQWHPDPDMRPGRNYAAVKIISKRNPDTYAEKMVSREVFSFRLINMAGCHPNIVDLYEVCEDDDNVYLVMELLEGGELFARIAERGIYTERDAANLVVSMLGSLAFCHRLNLKHRDVKPENFVFMEQEGDDADVKLTDFGIAHYSEDPSALCKSLCGTPLYVAPEVLLRQPYGPEADLWSLGVIVYIMLVGYPPFDDHDIVQLVKKIKYKPVKFDGSEWDLISEEGKHFLTNLLDKDASNRMSAQQALEHEWLRNNCQAATKNNLEAAQTNIKSFVHRKRWKAAIQGVKAMNRIHKMVEISRAEQDGTLDDISSGGIEPVAEQRQDSTSLQRHLGSGILRRYSSSSSDDWPSKTSKIRQVPLPSPHSSTSSRSRAPPSALAYGLPGRKRVSSSITPGMPTGQASDPGASANGVSMVLLPTDPAFESSEESTGTPFAVQRPIKRRGQTPQRVTYSPTAAARRMATSPVEVPPFSAHHDNGRVARTLSRPDGGGVVRKMSSHARKFVSRRKKGLPGSSGGERPPVMLEMGEQRKLKRFSLFKL